MVCTIRALNKANVNYPKKATMMETLSFISFAHVQSHLIPNNIISTLFYVCHVLLQENSKRYPLNPILAQAITSSTSLQQPKAMIRNSTIFTIFNCVLYFC